ncbi:MAG: benzoyl-CoA reductase subunit C [Chloracidobacterium sp.]|nr:benzoyl-CoA reductase subunit C [Chloracidobacterium sp.]
MRVDEIINQCETLYHDLDLNYVKDWKARHGSKAIGYLPVYVPRELVHAYGMLPVGIMGGGDNLEIIRGDAYFQSYICHLPRSVIELGVTGKLDCLDGVLFPAICDVIRNLSGMWKMEFPDKYVKYLDFPQNFARAGRDYYLSEIGQISQDFEEISGKSITSDDLNRSIRIYNENRRAIRELYDLRSEMPHRALTVEVYLLARAGNILEVTEHTKLLREYISAVRDCDRPHLDNVRVVVTGAFCEQPPLSLVRALENSGCYIVDDDWMLCNRYQTCDIPETDEPLRAIVDSYLSNTVSTASRYDDSEDKGKYLADMVRDREAEGVVFAAPSFCDPALLERPMLQSVLGRENIPYTAFKYAENTGQIQVIKEQTGTFADSIKLWGGE